MSKIKLVVEIDEERYKSICDVVEKAKKVNVPSWYAHKIIANGIPLPKGHGRLIDADELYGDFIDGTEGYDCQTWNRIEIGDIIDDAPTIIEADRNEVSE